MKATMRYLHAFWNTVYAIRGDLRYLVFNARFAWRATLEEHK